MDLNIISLSGQRSASIFPTSGCCCASPAETVSAAAVSSPPADRPSPANPRAKAPTSPATPPCLRANQWVYLISHMACLCLTNALIHELLILSACCPRPASRTQRRTARLGRPSVVSCAVTSNRCATPARGQRREVTTRESLRELPPTTPLTQPYVSSHRSQWVLGPGLCQHTVAYFNMHWSVLNWRFIESERHF